MSTGGPTLRSTLRADGTVELSLADAPTPVPGAGEVVVEMLAAPLHPADMSLLFARADPATAERATRDGRPITRLRGTEAMAAAQSARLDDPMTVGMEGAGRVASAGDAEGEALVGRVVAVWGGGTYARFRTARVAELMVLPNGMAAAAGAAAFINPMTALSMVETMRAEGHTGLVHTAAASTLGQMLCRLCQAESVPLVNIVRRPEQVALLRGLGAEHVIDTSEAGHQDQLLDALRTTRATIAFDAVGGGDLASTILHLMERAVPKSDDYQHYGSAVRKRLYLYGTLDSSPMVLMKNYGLAWDIGGYLLFHFLERIGPDGVERLTRRIMTDLDGVFAMRFHRTVSLADAIDPDVLREAAQRTTGEKILIDPSR